jgi:cell division septal protein FtsQ
MKTMDHRIAERRRGVAEQRAANRLRALVVLLALVVLVVAGLWLVRSPLLDVDRITVSGAVNSNPNAAMDQLGIGPGTPTVSVDAGALEAALLRDPWIEEARVVVTWPGTVEVVLAEHVPVAAIETADGFVTVTSDGVVVQMLDSAAGHATIVLPDPPSLRPGSTATGAGLLGAVEFIAGLPAEMHAATVVSVDRDEYLWATVDGFAVRIGRAVDLRSKAAATAAVIASGIEPGSTIDVTAPRWPAVSPPSTSS